MVVVAIVGLLCLLVRRHRSFASRAGYHESKTVAAMFHRSPGPLKYLGREIPSSDLTAELLIRTLARRPSTRFVYLDRAGKIMTPDEVKDTIWHEALARKYREASRYPWFPVMPDPPALEWAE
jgi:hypothetical protein